MSQELNLDALERANKTGLVAATQTVDALIGYARELVARIRELERAQPAGEAVAWMHEIFEPDGQHQTLYSASEHNPWSHWLGSYRGECRYQVTPLYAAPPAAANQAEPEATIFAWAEFDGEGGYDLRLFEENESYRRDYINRNGAKYADLVFPLYRVARAAPHTESHALGGGDDKENNDA